MKGGVLLSEGASLLRTAGIDDAESAAGWWVADVLGTDLAGLVEREVSAQEAERVRAGFRRLADHEPLQHVIGHAPFLDFSVRTDARALVPRPETEELVSRVVSDRAFWSRPGLAVADVGTGTGCIAIALARAWPSVEVWAVDISPEALALARENAVLNGVASRIRFSEGDLLASFTADSLDAVVSNPPYIARGVIDRLDERVRRFDPVTALDGGEDGLDVIRRLVEQAFTVLKNRGRVWIEIGEEQGEAVARILRSAGFGQVEIHRDMYGNNRFAEGVKCFPTSAT